MIHMSPLNIRMLRKKFAAGDSVFCVLQQRAATIVDIVQVGTGFQMVTFAIDGKSSQVLLDPGGRATDDGNFPFWEVDNGL
jgi:hypothetical protein